MSRLCFLPLVLLAGCAHAPMAYRLTNEGARPLLVPPGVAHPEQAQRTFVAPVTAGGGPCKLSTEGVLLQRRGAKIRLTVSRDALATKPAAWLSQWAGEAEDRGCIAPGQARALAAAVSEAVPLDPSVTFRLLHSNNVQAGYLDLGPEDRLEIVAPLMDSGPAPDGSVVQTRKVSGTGNNIQLDLELSPAVRGVETTEYAISRRPGGGYMVRPASVVRRIGGNTEEADKPSYDYLDFPATAAFFRLIYKADDNGVKAVVIGAATHAQLELGECGKGATCFNTPKSVGINPVISVTINGKATTLGIGMTVRNAILKGNVRRPADVLASLQVSKLYQGRLVPVQFVRGSESILDLKLFGGESIVF